MKVKPLKPHALEMLRLIGCSHANGHYWYPQDNSQLGEDAGGVFDVFVHGAETTGAIRTLTSRGLVEPVLSAPCQSGAGKWARRITLEGSKTLAEYLAPIIQQRRRARARRARESQ